MTRDLLALQIVGLGDVEADGEEAAHIPHTPCQGLDALRSSSAKILVPIGPFSTFHLLARFPDEGQLGDGEGRLDGGNDPGAAIAMSRVPPHLRDHLELAAELTAGKI
jgi:hypothetical protein